jgi:formate hydrogenlyase subunit 6/NADH:ubiquinone oxidoreductase subunit I
MKYPKLRELKEAITAAIKGPYTSKFPYVPHKPYQRFRGKSKYDADSCIGCAACYQVCPAGAIEFLDKIENGKAKRVFTLHWDICISCGQCQANCPTEKGIALSQEFDLATTESRQELKQEIEKALLICECCNEIIAPRDQVLWVAKKIGPLTFANASLMFFYLKNMGLAGKDKLPVKNTAGEVLRSDRIKVLCPRCRREAVVKS